MNIRGTLGGSGGTTGAVTVNSEGTLSPGTSIGTLNTAGVTLNGSSTFKLEINTSATTTDLLNATGNLTLDNANTVALAITDPGADVALSIGTTLSFIGYTGTWNGGTFTNFADDSTFTLGPIASASPTTARLIPPRKSRSPSWCPNPPPPACCSPPPSASSPAVAGRSHWRSCRKPHFRATKSCERGAQSPPRVALCLLAAAASGDEQGYKTKQTSAAGFRHCIHSRIRVQIQRHRRVVRPKRQLIKREIHQTVANFKLDFAEHEFTQWEVELRVRNAGCRTDRSWIHKERNFLACRQRLEVTNEQVGNILLDRRWDDLAFRWIGIYVTGGVHLPPQPPLMRVVGKFSDEDVVRWIVLGVWEEPQAPPRWRGGVREVILRHE